MPFPIEFEIILSIVGFIDVVISSSLKRDYNFDESDFHNIERLVNNWGKKTLF